MCHPKCLLRHIWPCCCHAISADACTTSPLCSVQPPAGQLQTCRGCVALLLPEDMCCNPACACALLLDEPASR